MIKVAFVIPSLRAGGAERVMSSIAESISSKDFEVSLIVVGHEKNQVYSVNRQKVELIFLGKDRVIKALFPLIRLFKEKEPDIVISAIGHLNIMLSFLGFFFKRIGFIAREANIDSVRKKFSKKKRLLGKLDLKKYGYSSLKTIICQSQDMYDSFSVKYPSYKEKMVIINNPISDGFGLKKREAFSEKSGNLIKLITVGSLHSRKGHKRILSTLSNFKFPFKYTIIGDGGLKKELFELAQSLGIINNIKHIPYTSEVPTYLCKSDFYLQGSYVEGFPNAVIESCAVGTPVLAFDAPGGIKEIIQNDVNGHVVDSEHSFLNQLNQYAVSNKFDPKVVSDSVTSRYGKEIIIDQYEALFRKVFKNQKE